MFCNFCGKNFDASEGFEEVTRAGHHYVRCEKCVYERQEEEYDWSSVMFGRFSRSPIDKSPAAPASGGRFQSSAQGGGRSASSAPRSGT